MFGWRPDRHGVDATGAMSSSSIADWRTLDRKVAGAAGLRARADRDLDRPRRTGDLRQRGALRPAGAAARGAAAPRAPAPPPAPGAGEQAADRLPARHRRRALRRARRPLRHQARRPAADREHRPLRGPRGGRHDHLDGRAPRGRGRRRDARPERTRRRSRRPSSCSPSCASSTRSRSSRRATPPDDQIDPKTLNRLTRRYLRDAFRAVASVQRSLNTKLAMEHLSATEVVDRVAGRCLPAHPDARSRDAVAGGRASACSTSRPPASTGPTTRSSPSRRCRSTAAARRVRGRPQPPRPPAPDAGAGFDPHPRPAQRGPGRRPGAGRGARRAARRARRQGAGRPRRLARGAVRARGRCSPPG